LAWPWRGGAGTKRCAIQNTMAKSERFKHHLRGKYRKDVEFRHIRHLIHIRQLLQKNMLPCFWGYKREIQQSYDVWVCMNIG
jgi:hypothetical protein